MQETKEFVEKVLPRLSKVRNERLDFIWSDFLGAVEKVINVLTDEQLAAANWITIIYETRKNDEGIYRSNIAEVWFVEKEEIVYGEEAVCLGTKSMLERTFKDFEEKAEQDIYCNEECFYVEDLFENDLPSKILLDFDVNRIEIEFKKTPEAKYKIISTN